MERFSRRHPWNHNSRFHGWLLRRLPAGRGAALDVGCGQGRLLGLLRSRAGFVRVVGVDPDPAMASASRARFASDAGVTVAQRSFLDLGPGDGLVPDGGFDAITMVASLHHLAPGRGLDTALAHARDLTAPGGRLLVVGLARARTPGDFVIDGVSVLLNPLVGLLHRLRRAPGVVPGEERGVACSGIASDDGARMPVRDPEESYGDVARAAARLLPGARVRHRLFFRYTLEWTAPAPAG